MRQALVDFMDLPGCSVRACAGIDEARQLLETGFEPDLVLLDYRLGDGDATTLLPAFESSEIWPAIIVITGQAGAHDAFELAELGVRAFVSKPATPDALLAALDKVAHEPPRLSCAMRSAVGHLPMHDVQDMVRQTMLSEALKRVRGNRSRAARLLSVSRQTLQHMLRSTEIEYPKAG
jgi:DNA-binding NtrC family response regulator